MAKKTEYFTYVNKKPSHLTVGDFIRDISSVGFGLDVKEFLNYTGEDGESNSLSIRNAIENLDLAYEHKIAYENTDSQSNSSLENLPFPIGAVVFIPFSKIDRSFGIIQSTNVVDSSDYESFLAKKLYDLLNDIQYKSEINNKSKSIDSVKDIFSNVSVWIWSRALSTKLGDKYQDTLIDISPFITNLTTNVSESGGNFSMGVSPIISDFNQDWKIDLKTIKIDAKNNNVISDTFFHIPDENNGLKRQNTYFKNILSQNDVVYIRFEKLELEEDRNDIDYSFEIDKSNLPNKTYDMIGLIDTVSENFNGESNDLSLNITGRDLMKLFIEDGVYFYPFEFTNESIFANMKTGATGEKLNRFNGQILSRFQSFNKTIDNTVKYIINALSTIEIASNTLFDSYKDKRTNFYSLIDDEESKRKRVAKNKEEKKKDIISLIDQARKSDKLDSYKQVSSFTVYEQVDKFIRRLLTDSNAKDNNGTLIGWGGFNYLGDILADDKLPLELEDLLFRGISAWRTFDGRIINDSEKIDLIRRTQRELDAIVKTQTELLDSTNRTNNDRKISNLNQRIDSAIITGDAGNGDPNRGSEMDVIYEEYKLALLEKNSLQTDQIQQTAAVSGATQSQIEDRSPELFENRRIVNEKVSQLDEEYNKIKKRKGGFYLTSVPTDYKKMKNSLAKQVIQEIYQLIKTEDNSPQKRELKEVRGIWQIIKLVVDDSVGNRRIVDSSIGNEHGSLINAMDKICVKPFCEFYTDTYGDQFYIIIRKQPFDKESIISYLDKRVNVKEDLPKKENLGDFTISQRENPPSDIFFKKQRDDETYEEKESIVIEIDEVDVLNTNLFFDTTAYSWYKILPINLIGGKDNTMAFAYLKAIYFPEFASMFGSKPLDLVTNYMPFFPITDKNEKIPSAYHIRQGLLDLKYMIESNCYLPFTRRGTILINGNRTIKRGTFVKLKSTNEIFYVDAVNNNYSISDSDIDRTTALEVSRGMIEPFIKGVNINGLIYSYFNICNTPIDESLFQQKEFKFTKFSETIAGEWKVNKEVFDFFIKKWQFAPISQSARLVEENGSPNKIPKKGASVNLINPNEIKRI